MPAKKGPQAQPSPDNPQNKQSNPETAIIKWLATIVAAVLVTVLGYFANYWANSVVKRLESIEQSNNTLLSDYKSHKNTERNAHEKLAAAINVLSQNTNKQNRKILEFLLQQQKEGDSAELHNLRKNETAIRVKLDELLTSFQENKDNILTAHKPSMIPPQGYWVTPDQIQNAMSTPSNSLNQDDIVSRPMMPRSTKGDSSIQSQTMSGAKTRKVGATIKSQ
jgi:hypothetical protein